MSEFNDFIKTILEGLDQQGNGPYANRAKNASVPAQSSSSQPVVGQAQQGMATVGGPVGTAGTQYAKNANPAIQGQAQQGMNKTPVSNQVSNLFNSYTKNPNDINFKTNFSKLQPQDQQAFMGQFQKPEDQQTFVNMFTPQEQQQYQLIPNQQNM